MPKKRKTDDPGRGLIEAFLAGRKIIDLPWDSVDPTGGVSKALGAFSAAMRGELPIVKALACFKAVQLEAIRSAEAEIIFLHSWFDLTFRSRLHVAVESPARPYDEMEAILKRMKSLLRTDSLPEMRAFVMHSESYLANARGNHALHLSLMEEALGLLSPGSLWHRRTTMLLANELANTGRLAEAEPLLKKIAAKSTEWEKSIVAAYRFIDAVEGCRTDEAVNAMTAMRDSEAFKSNRVLLEPYQLLCDRLANRWAANRSIPLPAEDLPRAPWAQVMEHLLAHRPEAALKSAQEYAAAHPTISIRQIGPDSWNLLRAELACGNGVAARRILVLRREVGNVHHLNDFFVARVELLAGNREAAARHFAAVTAACEEYRSLGRLDFELRMSCEISAADACWLGRTAAEAARLKSPVVPAEPIAPAPVPEPRGTDRLIGRSGALLAVKETVRRFAQSEAPVLVTGETGTGKELVARAIHDLGPNAAQPFIAVNCGTITESLLGSELFGHERGAFTGAERAHQGIFETAARGSVLLDEIGDMPLRLQVALLRVLETGEVRPVGSARSRQVACRIVAATNAPLESLVEEKRFRPDLLYRLQRLQIHLPPLRERTDDILPLVEHFLGEGRHDGLRPSMTRELQEWLLTQKWPGNVRELRNAVERMRLLNSEKLQYGLPELVPVRTRPPGEGGGSDLSPAPPTAAPAGQPASGSPADVERFLRNRRTPLRRTDAIRDLFRQHGKLTRAELAAIAGVSPFTIGRDLKRLLAEGFVEKVRPTAAARTHYFALRRSGE